MPRSGHGKPPPFLHRRRPCEALRRDHESGTLEPGRRADVVILDRRLDETTLGEISRTRVDLTLVDGEPVRTR
ncbi:amidohydrolase family protein [Streptomyces sp. NPDC058067]|uniref:amidohydrolase family protein n=1 Tax=Streptomyces sp. NPDC058067 TaxID=3346324 RepID=UPI0036EC3D84